MTLYDWTTCRSCGERVYWLKNEKTGKLAPINAAPVENGNIDLEVAAGVYRVVGKQEREQEPYPKRHTNHFMTCPAAGAWKRMGVRGVGNRRLAEG